MNTQLEVTRRTQRCKAGATFSRRKLRDRNTRDRIEGGNLEPDLTVCRAVDSAPLGITVRGADDYRLTIEREVCRAPLAKAIRRSVAAHPGSADNHRLDLYGRLATPAAVRNAEQLRGVSGDWAPWLAAGVPFRKQHDLAYATQNHDLFPVDGDSGQSKHHQANRTHQVTSNA
ncbi:MAG: hypothetical protein WCZ65_01295 [Lysobacteraceae bacterium]